MGDQQYRAYLAEIERNPGPVGLYPACLLLLGFDRDTAQLTTLQINGKLEKIQFFLKQQTNDAQIKRQQDLIFAAAFFLEKYKDRADYEKKCQDAIGLLELNDVKVKDAANVKDVASKKRAAIDKEQAEEIQKIDQAEEILTITLDGFIVAQKNAEQKAMTGALILQAAQANSQQDSKQIKAFQNQIKELQIRLKELQIRFQSFEKDFSWKGVKFLINDIRKFKNILENNLSFTSEERKLLLQHEPEALASVSIELMHAQAQLLELGCKNLQINRNLASIDAKIENITNTRQDPTASVEKTLLVAHDCVQDMRAVRLEIESIKAEETKLASEQLSKVNNAATAAQKIVIQPLRATVFDSRYQAQERKLSTEFDECEKRWASEAKTSIENYKNSYRNRFLIFIGMGNNDRQGSAQNFLTILNAIKTSTNPVYNFEQRIEILLEYIKREKAYVIKRHQQGFFSHFTSSALYEKLKAEESRLRDLHEEILQGKIASNSQQSLPANYGTVELRNILEKLSKANAAGNAFAGEEKGNQSELHHVEQIMVPTETAKNLIEGSILDAWKVVDQKENAAPTDDEKQLIKFFVFESGKILSRYAKPLQEQGPINHDSERRTALVRYNQLLNILNLEATANGSPHTATFKNLVARLIKNKNEYLSLNTFTPGKGQLSQEIQEFSQHVETINTILQQDIKDQFSTTYKIADTYKEWRLKPEILPDHIAILLPIDVGQPSVLDRIIQRKLKLPPTLLQYLKNLKASLESEPAKDSLVNIQKFQKIAGDLSTILDAIDYTTSLQETDQEIYKTLYLSFNMYQLDIDLRNAGQEKKPEYPDAKLLDAQNIRFATAAIEDNNFLVMPPMVASSGRTFLEQKLMLRFFEKGFPKEIDAAYIETEIIDDLKKILDAARTPEGITEHNALSYVEHVARIIKNFSANDILSDKHLEIIAALGKPVLKNILNLTLKIAFQTEFTKNLNHILPATNNDILECAIKAILYALNSQDDPTDFINQVIQAYNQEFMKKVIKHLNNDCSATEEIIKKEIIQYQCFQVLIGVEQANLFTFTALTCIKNPGSEQQLHGVSSMSMMFTAPTISAAQQQQQQQQGQVQNLLAKTVYNKPT